MDGRTDMKLLCIIDDRHRLGRTMRKKQPNFQFYFEIRMVWVRGFSGPKKKSLTFWYKH